MRDHNKAFCRLAVEAFDCPAPIYEFGAYQVEGQEDYANLRPFFPGKAYVGCDMRSGPGVDRVEDVSRMTIADSTAGTIIALETFEHVFEVKRAFDEVFRVLRPGGVFIMTSPFHFKIHGYPDDYWRITPSCLRRQLEPYAGRVVGSQGHDSTPHTVMAIAVKSPAPADFARRADRLVHAYHDWLREAESSVPATTRLRRAVGSLYRSKGERLHQRDYHRAHFTIDLAPSATLAKVG